MNESLKVQPHHLQRSAYLYIRQSSMRQVMENVESTKRQYALRNRATALGWRDDQIIVIDNDQGESGASAAWREGFQRLVTDVGMGHAGMVMGLEVSRLARNNADWHRLLEICALADTLILDEDGVYDPASFNDRLLLGLKGTMSEAELHVLKARLRGGIINKAQRGEYRCPLPTGLVYDEASNVVLDPDAQVRDVIAYFFETFCRVGSASQTVKVFRTEGLDFPSRLRGEATVFRPLTSSTAMRTLHNPRYAGAYAYGRRQYRRGGGRRRQEDDPAKTRGQRLAGLHSRGPSRLHQLGAISGECQNPRSKRPWLQCGACVAASRRSSFTPRTRRLRAVRKALSRSLCRAAWKTRSVVRLRSGAHGSRRTELPVDCGRAH